jgi:DNA-binding MarR family transcriptional regulator
MRPLSQPLELQVFLRDTMIALIRRDARNLTARQLAIFLVCYLTENEHTVRGLALILDVGKPTISRALDRLAEFDLIRRKVDPADRRSVLVGRTKAGGALMKQLEADVTEAATGKTPQSPSGKLFSDCIIFGSSVGLRRASGRQGRFGSGSQSPWRGVGSD